MSFNIQLEKVSGGEKGASGIVFAMSLENSAPRTATILSSEFQLWLRREATGDASFLGVLLSEFFAGFEFQMQFDPHNIRRFRVVWHYTPNQLQQIEDWREDGEPCFEIRGRLSVVSVWPGVEGKLQAPSFSGESFYANSGYPLRFTISHAQWASLLDQIGFRHIVLYELPWSPLPPGFSRSEVYLKEAWDHHRAGRRDETLLACRKVFEPLGFNLFGVDGVKRQEILARLMTQAAPQKREAILKLWESLQNFSNFGVHERGKAVELTKADTELAVICTTAMMGYLAKQK